MRLLVDTLVAMMLAAVVGGVLLHYRTAREEAAAIGYVQESVRRIELQVKYRSATESADLNGREWPVTIDPEWFSGDPPRNMLLDAARPWLEVAPPAHADLAHPPVRIAVDETVAAFWYNPGNGAVRARAPVSVSDRRSLEIYNRINGSALDSIFAEAPPEAPAAASESGLAGAEQGSEAAQAAAEPEDLDPTRPLQ